MSCARHWLAGEKPRVSAFTSTKIDKILVLKPDLSEFVEIAGGIDIFADRRNQGAAKDRVVTVEEVVAREPDLIIGSWCGKKFRPERGPASGKSRLCCIKISTKSNHP